MRIAFLSLLLIPIIALAQEAPMVEEVSVETQAVVNSADPYTISNVVVDVTADNAVLARKEAFAKGAELAVQKWIELQGGEAASSIPNPDALVRDFQVNKEQFTRTRYIATLTYRFKPQSMARLINNGTMDVPVLPIDPNADAVSEEATPPVPEAPVDYDQPWTPAQPGQAVPPPAETPAPAPVQETIATWRLLVQYDQVAQWLVAENLITGRPEIRGMKMISMGNNQAELEITSAGSLAETQARWSNLGWNVSSGGDVMSLDATTMGH
jgi:hypothetical protein